MVTAKPKIIKNCNLNFRMLSLILAKDSYKTNTSIKAINVSDLVTSPFWGI